MTEFDDLVQRYILRKYREGHPRTHLAKCDEIELVDPSAEDGYYGCDTGCEYFRFEATLRCSHGESVEYEWGDFGMMADLFPALDRLRATGT